MIGGISSTGLNQTEERPDEGLDAELLRRHLQSPVPRPDRYINQEALDLLPGLMRRPGAEGQQNRYGTSSVGRSPSAAHSRVTKGFVQRRRGL
jgi:hypothetical protein